MANHQKKEIVHITSKLVEGKIEDKSHSLNKNKRQETRENTIPEESWHIVVVLKYW